MDQLRRTKNTDASIRMQANFTEPLSLRSFLNFGYSIGNQRSDAQVQTLEKESTENEKYESLIDSLSNAFRQDIPWGAWNGRLARKSGRSQDFLAVRP